MRKIKEIEAEKSQNWTSIGTLLIKEAAKCENFASDILIDCTDTLTTIAEEKEFSELGENLTNAYVKDVYFALYRLNVTKERAYGSYDVTYTLYRIVNEE